MFSSSARLATFSAQSTSIAFSLKTAVPRSVTAQALSYRRLHQRRCSSSKPSSPPDGSKGVSEGQQVPSSSAQARSDGDEKTGTRVSRRRTKDATGSLALKAKDDTLQNLPTVPNTHHIKDKEIAASAFFSLHRPISVTSSFPKAITDDAFAAIFSPWTKLNRKSAGVISMLSNAPYKLGSPTTPERLDIDGDELRSAVTSEVDQGVEGDVKQLDQSTSGSYIPFPQHILSGQYQPFNPPPPPQPRNKAESPTGHAEVSNDTVAPQYQTYTVVITIEESTDANGEVTLTARSTPLVAEDQNQSHRTSLITNSRGRRSTRQQHFERSHEQRAQRTGIWAISVKRQRKLKMKKHKYKKLMRRTRNLRRRLDRN